MNRIYNNKSAKRQAEIDAAIETVSSSDMRLAREACNAVSRGYPFDFEELKKKHPKAHEITMLFMSA